MYKKNIILFMLVLSCLTFGSILMPIATSDGCIFIPTYENWIMTPEEKQMALIEYENGIENLTIAVDLRNSSLKASQTFWIFPVPGKPEDASIDIINNPDFYYSSYEDIRDSAKDEISGSLFFMTMSQAYIGVVPLIYYLYSSFYGMGYKEDQDLEIYQHIEKMGLVSELIYANTSDVLDFYLEDKNISLPENATEIINEYIGKEYSFVVSWISDLETFKKEAYGNDNYHFYWGSDDPHYIFGLSVTFPTDDIFYPMRLTSVYDDKIIPILIQVKGHATPINTYSGLQTDYYRSFTEIIINTKSSEFTKDLWIKNKAPNSVENAKFISSNLVLISIIVFILASIFASLISSIIVYLKNKPIIWKFALIGLFNFLTIFFVFFVCSVFKISQNFVKKPVKEKNLSKKIIFAFRLAFLIIGILTVISIGLMFSNYLFVFMLAALLITYGVLMIIYGGLKNPRITLYTGLFSIFFFLFLFIFMIMFNFFLYY